MYSSWLTYSQSKNNPNTFNPATKRNFVYSRSHALPVFSWCVVICRAMLTTPRSRQYDWSMLKRAVFAEALLGRIEQCSNGHLMCAEAEIEGPDLILNRDGGTERQEQACASQVRAVRGPKCPVCRQGLTDNAIRGLSAEHSIAVLPARCRHCHGGVSRGSLRAHQAACFRAPVRCVAEGCR